MVYPVLRVFGRNALRKRGWTPSLMTRHLRPVDVVTDATRMTVPVPDPRPTWLVSASSAGLLDTGMILVAAHSGQRYSLVSRTDILYREEDVLAAEDRNEEVRRVIVLRKLAGRW